MSLNGEFDEDSIETTSASNSRESGPAEPTIGSGGMSAGSAPTAGDSEPGTTGDPTNGADACEMRQVGRCDPFGDGGGGCEEGETCRPFRTDEEPPWETACVVAGDGAQGEPCSRECGLFHAADSCGPGLVCDPLQAEDGDDGVPTCMVLCEGGDRSECPYGPCEKVDGLFGVCTGSCDPVRDDCPEGERCVVESGDEMTFSRCAEVDATAGPSGTSCSSDIDCEPGLACADLCRDGLCCAPYCSMAAAEAEHCPCSDLELKPPFEHLGVCLASLEAEPSILE